MRRVLVLIAAAGVVALLLWLQGEDDGRVERSGLPTSAVDEGERNGASTTEPEDLEEVATPTDDDDPRRISGPDVVLIGRVEHNGEGVPNATVEARRYDESIAIADIRTGGDGAFRLNFARRTKLVLTARDDEDRCASALVLIPDRGNPDEVVIRLRDAHPFGGIVLNPDGTPHAGATVRLTSDRDWHAYSTQTGPDGRFAFAHVNSGSYEIHIEAHGFPVIRRFADVPGLRDFKATLFAGGSIRGTLRDDSLRPIQGATITLHSGDGRKSPAGIATVTTQPDGSFHMPNVMPGPCWRAIVSHPDWGRRLSAFDEVALPVEPVHAGKELSWNITLAAYSTLVIRAVAEESGAPIEGALVSVVPTRHFQSDRWLARRQRTDARGIASFSHTTYDGIFVRLEHRFRLLQSGDQLVTGRPIYVDQWRTEGLVLKCALAGMVEGCVRGGSRADGGLIGVRLVLGPNDNLWTDVDGGGRFRFPAVQEAREVLIVAEAAQLKSRRFEIVAGARTWVDVDLPHKAAVTGVVVDGDRKPVKGAKVRVVPTNVVEGVVRRTEERTWKWKYAESTNARGEFVVFSNGADRWDGAGSAGAWSVVVLHPDYRPLRKDGLNRPDENAPQSVSLELHSGESIEGAVHFATGQPAPNIPVEALPDGTGPNEQAPRRVMTDSNGKFTLRGLEDGTWALKALHGEGVSRPVSARAGASDVRVTIEMHPPITGLVLDDEDRPIGGALVELERRRQPTLTARTEPNGRFRLEHVAPGSHRLKVKPLQWMTSKGLQGCAHFPRFESDPVEAGSNQVVLRAKRGSVLSGRVLDAAGNSVPRAAVVAHIKDGWIVIANTDGEFSIKGAGDDPVTVYATGNGQPIRAVELLPNRGLTEIRLPSGGSIRGRVLDAVGQPAKGVVVRVTPEVDTLRSAAELSHELAGVLRLQARKTAVTGNDGSFLFRAIETGAYTIQADSEDGASSSARIQTDGPAIDLRLEE